jgi:hypothetical protein
VILAPAQSHATRVWPREVAMKHIGRDIVLTFVLTSTIGLVVQAQWRKLTLPDTPRNADGTPDLTAPTPKTANAKPDLSGIWRLDRASEAEGRRRAVILRDQLTYDEFCRRSARPPA